jgi:hypothetical protein
MKKLLVIAALLCLLAVPSYGQMLNEGVKANIEFSFLADGKTLPPGTYIFKASELGNMVQIQSKDGKQTIMAPVLTRLALPTKSEHPYLTFDEVNGKMMLEAIWPGEEEGYLLSATKEKHAHKKVKIG